MHAEDYNDAEQDEGADEFPGHDVAAVFGCEKQGRDRGLGLEGR